MTIERQVISGLKWAAVGKLGSQIINWAITIVVVRLLAPADYGLVAMANVAFGLVWMVAELGLGASIIQAPSVTKVELRRLFGASVLLYLAAAALLCASAPLVATFFQEPRLTPIVLTLALHFLLHVVAFVPNAMTYRAMRFKLIATLDLSFGFVGNVATLALALAGMGVWSIVLGGLLGGLMRVVALVAVTREWVWPSFDLTGIRKQIAFGGTLALSRLIWYVYSQADVVIAGKFLGNQALGLYSVATHLATVPMQRIMAVVNQVAFSAVARMQEERDKLPAQMAKAARFLGYASFSSLWGIGAVAPEIAHGLLGEKWLAVVLPLQLMSIVLPLRMLEVLIVTAVSAVGRADVDLRNNLTSAAVLPVAFLVGVQYGVNGLAAAWVLVSPCVFVVNFGRSAKVLGLKWGTFLRELRSPVAAGLVMVGFVRSGAAILEPALPPVARLVVLVLGGAIVFAGMATLIDPGVWREARAFLLPPTEAASPPGRSQ